MSTRPARPEPSSSALSVVKPNRKQIILVTAVLATLVGALFVTVPFADRPLAGTESFLPAYAAAVMISDLITSALLLALSRVERSRGLLALGLGYFFAGLTIIPWVLTFPGVFAPDGLMGAGLQSTAAVAAARRIGFPVSILVYVLYRHAPQYPERQIGQHVIILAVTAIILLVLALSWGSVAAENLLPNFMADRLRATSLWSYVPAISATICIAAGALLWGRQHSVLDLWLLIVLVASLIEILLLSYFSGGRLSLGWWAGRLYGLAAASVVLIALLTETTAIFSRLLHSLSAERRMHEARMTTLEALAASIAHEVNQPLASVVTNAGAAERWLDRETPNLDEARQALKRVVSDGHRASAVIQGVRAVFSAGARERRVTAINDLVLQSVAQTREEARHAGVTVHYALGDALPRVNVNPVQVQQVLVNLVINAIDAMSTSAARPRILNLASEAQSAGSVRISVSDTGTGLDPEARNRVFEPFFTTKGHGMGMGLMICRTIIEAHGGRIWITANQPAGVTVQFTLPAGGGAPAALETPDGK